MAADFAPGRLSAVEKHSLCMDLLAEFGAQNIMEKGDEILHSCLLPFGRHQHGDRNPSASLNYEKLTYSCWVCGGGGLLWFISQCKKQTIDQTYRWIVDRPQVGGVQSTENFLAFINGLYQEAQVAPVPPMPHYDTKVLDDWRFIHPYLTDERHLPRENLIQHNICFDSARAKVIIPHFWEGKLVGWQERDLTGKGPKYKNTPYFPRDTTVYNFDPTIEDVIVVESPMSVLAHCHQAHIEATFGAKVTDRQRLLLSKHTGRVILWFDNDTAGWGAMRQNGEWFAERRVAWVVNSPYVGDPADLDPDTFAQVLAERVIPFVVWQQPDPEDLIAPQTKETEVGITKYGTGSIIPDDDDERPGAPDNQDRGHIERLAAVVAEGAQADSDGPTPHR